MFRFGLVLGFVGIVVSTACGQTQTGDMVRPDWCRAQPRIEYKSLQRVPLDNTWFEVYRVAPGVLAIYEPHQWEETVMYLIEGSQRALLFDTGMGIGDLQSVVKKLTPLPVVVVNSHTHPDHVGDNWQFTTIYDLDTAYTRKNMLGSTEVREEIAPGKLCGQLPKGFDASAYATRPWKVTKWLRDGDTISLGGRTLEVYATPGHAPDALCLFDSVNGLLFTGDTYYPGAIYVFGPGSDAAEYQRSADRLAALEPQVKMVFGGHNAPDSSPTMLTEMAQEFAEVRAGKIKGTPEGQGISKFVCPHLIFYVGAAN